ncbi:MAG: pyruvoyl-dependent arginine decarboxylase [bacterium]|nr:pyruvoyl-dependent arginine decarboxylase [bacterium]
MNAKQKIERTKSFPVYVISGIAEGKTRLSAFDGALRAAGIANFNLLHLSSVIHFCGEVIVEKPPAIFFVDEKIGNRLYVVYARQEEDEPGKQACAGLGWALTVNNPRYGLFVEHMGRSEADVVENINRSLSCMTEGRKRECGHVFGETRHSVSSITCEKMPVCAVVIAVYKDEPW